MDFKDKFILWTLGIFICWVIGVRSWGIIIEFCVIGIIIKTIDVNFTQIIYWIREHFNTESRQ